MLINLRKTTGIVVNPEAAAVKIIFSLLKKSHEHESKRSRLLYNRQRMLQPGRYGLLLIKNRLTVF